MQPCQHNNTIKRTHSAPKHDHPPSTYSCYVSLSRFPASRRDNRRGKTFPCTVGTLPMLCCDDSPIAVTKLHCVQRPTICVPDRATRTPISGRVNTPDTRTANQCHP